MDQKEGQLLSFHLRPTKNAKAKNNTDKNSNAQNTYTRNIKLVVRKSPEEAVTFFVTAAI